MSTQTRPGYFEIWSRTQDGRAHKHGGACGRTFDDACKHLASESVDFWTHYDKGRYRGRALYPSEALALGTRASEAASERSADPSSRDEAEAE
ncbi:MAG: hypothetical protein PVI30_22145 [Myxococcales bacterium]|jgi:hypothetical protein